MPRVGFQRRKFEELIVYIAKRLGPEAALGRVKLAKLLMLCDFESYVRTGEPITGSTYEKWEHGHFPREMVMAEKDLASDGSTLTETVDYFGKKLQHITAGRDPNMADFSEDELGLIEGVLHQYGYESATHLKWLSHQEPGWKIARDRQEIPYGTAFIGREPLPESVLEEHRQLFARSA